MRKPQQYMLPANPDYTDRVIERQFGRFNDLVDRHGWVAAKEEVVAELTAVALWLRQAYGPRATYGVLQQVADSMAKLSEESQ